MKRIRFALIYYIMFLLFAISGSAWAAPLTATPLHSQMLVSATQLNVRSGPSVSANKLTVLAKNTEVTALAVKDGWFKITYGKNLFGWVSGDYLYTKGTQPEQKIIKSYNAVVLANDVAVRAGMAENSTLLTKLAKDSVVAVVYEQGDYAFVRVNDTQEGFVAKKYLKKAQMMLSSWDEPAPIGTFKKADESPSDTQNGTTGGGSSDQNGNTGGSGSSGGNGGNSNGQSGQEIKILTLNGSQDSASSSITKLEAVRKGNEFVLRIATNQPVSYSAKQDGPQITIKITDTLGLAEGNYDLKTGSVDALQVVRDGRDTVLNIFAAADSTFTTQNIPAQGCFEIHIPVAGGLLAGKTIVVDAGHGGMQWGSPDPGATGKTGLKERDVVLDIAKKTRDLLQIQGATVLMTREGDSTNLSLAGRAQLANDNHADAFVAIHVNANTNTAVAGTSTYFYAGSPETKGQYAERQKLAQAVQNALVEKLKRRNIGILQANFQVLRDTRVPSILVETAFISNPEEESLLADEYFRQQAAEGIANGLINYFTQQ